MLNDKRFCTNCGRQISKNVKFCPYCGKRQESDSHVINENNEKPKRKSNQYNPHHISKKSKKLLAGIFTCAVLGGFGYYCYEQSPASVNLSQQLNNKEYNSTGFARGMEKLSDEKASNSDNKQYVANFQNGKAKFSPENNSDSSDDSYRVSGKNLILTDSDSSAKIGLTLTHVSDHKKKFNF